MAKKPRSLDLNTTNYSDTFYPNCVHQDADSDESANESRMCDPYAHQGMVSARSGVERSAVREASSYQQTAVLGSYRIKDRKKNKPPINIWSRQRIVSQFKDYLSSTAKCSFIIHGLEWTDLEDTSVENKIGYIHRWTPIYRKAVIAKMYLLEKWQKENPEQPMTMGTFTTYQDGNYSRQVARIYDIQDAFVLLKRSWQNIRMWLKFYYPDLSFVYFFEPHKSGYPHLHVLFFGNLPETAQNKIKLLWSEKYKAGSYEHGVDFKPIENIKSVRNYLVKYLSKILRQTGVDSWTEGELLFNAIMWREKYRLWGASRNLSKAMEKPKKEIENPEEIPNYKWTYTELENPNGDIIIVKKLEGYQIPIKGGDKRDTL